MLCTRCGAHADGPVTEDYAYCRPCDDDHQAWLEKEYPFGQCQECGAEGVELAEGAVIFYHAEGQCSRWVDYADYALGDIIAELRRVTQAMRQRLDGPTDDELQNGGLVLDEAPF